MKSRRAFLKFLSAGASSAPLVTVPIASNIATVAQSQKNQEFASRMRKQILQIMNETAKGATLAETDKSA